ARERSFAAAAAAASDQSHPRPRRSGSRTTSAGERTVAVARNDADELAQPARDLPRADELVNAGVGRLHLDPAAAAAVLLVIEDTVGDAFALEAEREPVGPIAVVARDQQRLRPLVGRGGMRELDRSRTAEAVLQPLGQRAADGEQLAARHRALEVRRFPASTQARRRSRDKKRRRDDERGEHARYHGFFGPSASRAARVAACVGAASAAKRSYALLSLVS